MKKQEYQTKVNVKCPKCDKLHSIPVLYIHKTHDEKTFVPRIETCEHCGKDFIVSFSLTAYVSCVL